MLLLFSHLYKKCQINLFTSQKNSYTRNSDLLVASLSLCFGIYLKLLHRNSAQQHITHINESRHSWDNNKIASHNLNLSSKL